MIPVKRSSDPKGCHSPYVGNHCSKAVLNSSSLYCHGNLHWGTLFKCSHCAFFYFCNQEFSSHRTAYILCLWSCSSVLYYLVNGQVEKKNLRLFAILDIYFTQLLQWSNYTCIYNPYTLCLDKKAFKNVDVIIIQIRV